MLKEEILKSIGPEIDKNFTNVTVTITVTVSLAVTVLILLLELCRSVGWIVLLFLD